MPNQKLLDTLTLNYHRHDRKHRTTAAGNLFAVASPQRPVKQNMPQYFNAATLHENRQALLVT
jgi:hypothetical protein